MNQNVQEALKNLAEDVGRLAALRTVLDGVESDMARLSKALRDEAAQVPRQPAVLRFDAPVGTEAERNGDYKVWPGAWFDATGFAVQYQSSSGKQAYHTGADLNLPEFADVNAPVFACADGEVVFSGAVPGWQGMVVCVRHVLETGEVMWSRYAHIKDVLGLGTVKRGQQVGQIADYVPTGPAGDHLHFDISYADLGAKPDDWPGMDVARVRATYRDPQEFIAARCAHGEGIT